MNADQLSLFEQEPTQPAAKKRRVVEASTDPELTPGDVALEDRPRRWSGERLGRDVVARLYGRGVSYGGAYIRQLGMTYAGVTCHILTVSGLTIEKDTEGALLLLAYLEGTVAPLPDDLHAAGIVRWPANPNQLTEVWATFGTGLWWTGESLEQSIAAARTSLAFRAEIIQRARELRKKGKLK